MAIFNKKKAEPEKPKPITYRAESIKRVIDCFRIGSRIRFHREYEDAIVMESLIIGYYIDGELVFQPKQIEFNAHSDIPSLVIKGKTASQSYTRLTDFYLLLPADLDLESQLDADSRASLGKRGPFIKGTFLKVMSFQPGKENLCCDCIVARSFKVNNGLHAGRTIVQIEVCMGTLEVFEPRCESRVMTTLPVQLAVPDARGFLEAQMLDFSESAIRIGLVDMKDQWPEYSKKDNALLTFTDPITGSPISLECKCASHRGNERVFEIKRIKKLGQLVPYTDLDALELKINLLNAFDE